MKTWQPDFPVPGVDAAGRLTLTASEPEVGYVQEGDMVLWQGVGWTIQILQRPGDKVVMTLARSDASAAPSTAPAGPMARSLAGVAGHVARASETLVGLRDIGKLEARVTALETGLARVLQAMPGARPRKG